jgi:hypothetical protein
LSAESSHISREYSPRTVRATTHQQTEEHCEGSKEGEEAKLQIPKTNLQEARLAAKGYNAEKEEGRAVLRLLRLFAAMLLPVFLRAL